MVEFLLEVYVSRRDRAAVEESTRRARRAAEQLSREGAPVRFLRSLFVPDEETCFYLYDADSAERVGEAARRAGLPSERVVTAVIESAEPDRVGEPKGASDGHE